MTASTGKRLNKFISDSGYCSRREADKLIESKKVRVNGKPAELGTRVLENDEVIVNGRKISSQASNKTNRVYIAYHKPVGITCTTELEVQGNIIDAIGHRERIFPIGRLDKPSEGLILLTSDGDIVNKILRAENSHDKEYVVTVDTPLSERFVERMSRGVPILNTVTKPCKVTVQSKYVFTIVLTQGLNRQIRRMCEFLGYNVTRLKRERVMNITLGDLKPGEWRDLTAEEMDEINKSVAHSRKTAVEKPLTVAKTVYPADREKPQKARTPAHKKADGHRNQVKIDGSPYGQLSKNRSKVKNDGQDPWGKARKKFDD